MDVGRDGYTMTINSHMGILESLEPAYNLKTAIQSMFGSACILLAHGERLLQDAGYIHKP